MTPEPKPTEHLLPLVLVLLAGAVLWYAHATAWDLGGRSPILSYDSAQYALAARELAWHGVLATPYALPMDLAWHSTSPWPLSAVQPGLVLVEALIFKLVPAQGAIAGSDPRAWLTLLLPFASYLMLGAATTLGTRRLLRWSSPEAPRWMLVGAPATLGLMVLLDPEAQHFAVNGLTELPFTVLFLGAALALARGLGDEQPLAFGLLLGAAGLFRANMLWLAPTCALAAMGCAPPGRRLRVVLLVLLGFCLPLAPWWLYKWRAFGSPAWDVTRFVVWDGVDGRNWFELYHRPEVPALPHGFEALRLLAAKAWGNAARMLLPLLQGPRALWFGALVAWLLTRPRRPLAAAALVLLAGMALNVAAACVSIPWTRYVFPLRVLTEAAGLLALWSLLQRMPGASERVRSAACVAVALLALVWGTWLTRLAHEESREASHDRGVPSSATLTSLSVALNEVLTPGETVMSNLGPALAWQTNHSVVHLAFSPADVPACRQRHDFRHIVLGFRSADRAWDHWQEIMQRPGAAESTPELALTREHRFLTADGFTVVWLELGPLPARMAAATR